MWDLGGQTSIRPYWRCYYADTKAVVYVVDSTDRERLNINKAELLAMMNEEELQDAKLLVFANKQVRASVALGRGVFLPGFFVAHFGIGIVPPCTHRTNQTR